MVLLALALLAAAPASAKGAKPAATPARAPASSFVLLNRATWLRVAPSDDAQKVRDPRVGQPRLSKTPLLEEDFWVLRFVEKDAKGWVTVETVPGLAHDPVSSGESTHCYPGAQVSGLALRFFVRAEELQTVLTKTVAREAQDGTGFTLRPGVAVGRPTDERIPVSIDGLRFLAKIPADHVGTTYAPSSESRFGLAKDDALTRIAPAATVTLDGASVDVTRALFTLAPSGTRALEGGGSLVTIEWNCGSYRLKVVTPNGTPAVEQLGGLMGGLGMMGGGDAGAARPVVKAGAKAWWRNGAAAGHAVEEIEPGAELAKAGKRRCFGFALRKDPFGLNRPAKDPLEVCFDAKDVTAR